MHLIEEPLLSKRQLEILKSMYTYKEVPQNEFETIFNVRIDDKIISPLRKHRLLEVDTAILYHPVVKLTIRGVAYLENRKSEKIKHWIPIILSNSISIVALIVAILAYIKQ